MHSIEIDCFLCQPKTTLIETSTIQAHQRSKTQLDTSIIFDNFLLDKTTMYCMFPSRKREQNICYVFIMWYSLERNSLFYNMTHKPAVTHFLKTLLEYDFYDVKVLIIYDMLKNLLAFILALLMYNIKIDFMSNHFNFFC